MNAQGVFWADGNNFDIGVTRAAWRFLSNSRAQENRESREKESPTCEESGRETSSRLCRSFSRPRAFVHSRSNCLNRQASHAILREIVHIIRVGFEFNRSLTYFQECLKYLFPGGLFSVFLNILKPDSRWNEAKCFLNAFITAYSLPWPDVPLHEKITSLTFTWVSRWMPKRSRACL